MAHYNSYDSFKLKKSINKKNKIKENLLSKTKNIPKDFIVEDNNGTAIIIEVSYNSAWILYNNEVIEAKLRKGINVPCNKIFLPGDKVKLLEENNNYIIENLIKRNTILTRIKKDSTRVSDNVMSIQSIAANITLAVITVAAKEPPLHPKFIDRYLIILENSNIKPIICLNKCDLKTEKEDKILDVYRNLNIPIIETSTYTHMGIENLKKCLRGNQAILVGNSGVGKSSLINEIMKKEKTAVGNISMKSKRGRHTTTKSKFYVWEENSSIIDTPGIRSLDVSTFTTEEIKNYFKEFAPWRNKCKYKDCLHYKETEKDCMVKQAVKKGIINKDRYESYIRIIKNILKEE